MQGQQAEWMNKKTTLQYQKEKRQLQRCLFLYAWSCAKYVKNQTKSDEKREDSGQERQFSDVFLR